MNTRDRAAAFTFKHVYNREQNREPMFVDDEDRRMFLWIVRRHLGEVVQSDSRGRPYRNFRGELQLLSFALMTNHFHLVIRQLKAGALRSFMNGVMSSYVRYFNRRHGTSGSIFVGAYRAAPKEDRRSRLNAIAYVHDNHGSDCRCEFCSHRLFLAKPEEVPSWIAVDSALREFGGRDEYLRYRQFRQDLKALQ